MSSRRLIAGAAALIVATGVALAWTSRARVCESVAGTDSVTVDVSGLAHGMARTFCFFDDAGRELRFVLARGNDGAVRSVFDACRECFGQRKGFAIADGDLVCRVCGNRYPIDHVHEGKASCVPVKLAHEEDSGSVRIRVSELLKGRSLF
jgi:uncharacterized membrane protein